MNSNNIMDREIDQISEEQMMNQYQQFNEQIQQQIHPNNDLFQVLGVGNISPLFQLHMYKPKEWRDQIKVMTDPYQYLICNVERKDCRKFNRQMIYAHLLYFMREWSILSSNQVDYVLSKRDSDLQCFEFNKQGKVAILHNTRIILHENSNNYRKGNELQQKSIFVLENEDMYSFIAPSYKFSEILIASKRNSLHLLKQSLNSEKNCYQLQIIKEYNGFNAEIGRFSRDGKYFIFTNNISPKLFILDLFCHKIFERNTNQKSISEMSFSRSGLNFITTCRETNTLNIYECVLWEKMQFKFNSPIFFADFLDESQNQEMANCILVILQSGEVQIIKDMQFNMLNSLNKRINFDFLERQQFVEHFQDGLPHKIIQHIFIDNILFIISEIQYEASNNVSYSFQFINLNVKNSKFITYDSLQIHENIRFIVTPNKQSVYEITLYNLISDISNQNSNQPFFEKVSINIPKSQQFQQQQVFSKNDMY